MDQKKQMPLFVIIVPCYNEQELIKETSRKLNFILEKLISQSQISENSFVLFVDDGSQDETWSLIKEAKQEIARIKGIKLSRNFGHQAALLAGMMKVKETADCIVSIDGDLQQDENVIPEFIKKYNASYDIVYGVRKSRTTDKLFKKITATFFYKLMTIMGVGIIPNHADYRLVSKKVLTSLSDYSEVNLFLRGIFPIMGYKTTTVYHQVKARVAGQSKYTLKKMLDFAFNGITSFSIVPIRIITFLGFGIFLFSLGMTLFVVFAYLFFKTVPGWASILLPIYFIGGVQLLSLGLIGEYIGKIYLETKRRPRYIVEEECS